MPAPRRAQFRAYPFKLGVASGSPLPDGVVLWTRVAPEPFDGGGGAGPEPVEVRWEVAGDEGFAGVVRRGTFETRRAEGHSVHVEVDGLQPAREYFYRFLAGGEASPTGRTRTAPPRTARPRALRFGLGSCQHFEHGHFAAHRHLLAEDLDLMLFVGDYIYESPGRDDQLRRHYGPEARTLADYRIRHAQYKTDPDLQRLHAAVPWLVTWDDHEVDNNYAGTRSESLDRDFPRRRAAAYQAYWEHMPLRAQARPTDSRMVLRSRHDVGGLARFHLLDGRQRRTPQACPRRGRGGARLIDERCAELTAPGRTMLGGPQERWLERGLRAGRDRWHFIAQQTLVARQVMPDGRRRRISSDSWDGYPAARDRLLGWIADSGLQSCVVLSGDAHTTYVCDLRRDFGDPGSPVVATEVCGTSISTRGRDQRVTEAIVRANPHMHYGNSERRGYVVVDVTPQRCTMALRVIGDPADPATGVSTAATFAVDAGRPGARRLT